MKKYYLFLIAFILLFISMSVVADEIEQLKKAIKKSN